MRSKERARCKNFNICEPTKTDETYQSGFDNALILVSDIALHPIFQRHFLAVLTNLLWIMTEEHYERYLKEFSNNKELKDFLVNVFVVFTEIVKRGIFLRDWIVIIILANR